jgi:hypothetical protein
MIGFVKRMERGQGTRRESPNPDSQSSEALVEAVWREGGRTLVPVA